MDDTAAMRWFRVGTRHLGLAPREGKALWWLVSAGHTDREIAARLHVEPHTVSTYLWEARHALGLGSTGRLALVKAFWEYMVTAERLARFGPPGGA